MRLDHVEFSDSSKSLVDHVCFQKSLSIVVECLLKLPRIDSLEFEKSKSIRELLSKSLTPESGWENQILGIESVPVNLPSQNYTIDYSTDSSFENCLQRHRLLLEICFDNRQAVGTNILKLEIAAANFTEKTGGIAIGVILCADRNALRLGGWDSGVADEEEYQVAIGTAYRKLIKENVSILVLRP